MKTKYIVSFIIISLIESILVLPALMGMKFESGRGNIFNYETLRLILAGVVILALLASAACLLGLFIKPDWGRRLSAWLDKYLVETKKRLFFVQGAFLVLAAFLVECFLMTYLAFPEPTRPIFLWAALICLQAWLILRIAYRGVYRQRPSLLARLRAKWTEAPPIQRKVFAVIAILSLVYFAAFIPLNLLRDEYGNFPLHADEKVLYPDITQGMFFEGNVSSMVHSVLEKWPWQYGYPYFTASAAALLIPRLIFGDQFTAQVQLNIFLLRQLVSVAPMVLSLVLAVYLVTRFKNMWASVGMFVFLATVPGIVKYNIHFWHADAMVVLLVMLTIYALQKDRLRFGRFFYWAAIFCALAAATKLWGLFFGPVIAGYLLAGLFKKQLTVGKFFLSGLLFLLAMLAAVFISSPTLMAPYIARVALRSWLPMQGSLLTGYGGDTSGFYDKNLFNWLKYFGYHFMKGYFFFFAFLALIAGSLWGARVRLNRILLGWCATTVLFLAYFVALKNFQYMLPLAVPLYCGAFLLPTVTEGSPDSKWSAFLARPTVHKITWAITILMFASQFIINVVILVLYAIRGR